ncbi:hypothetical protein B0H11DRAFT_2066661 [Mycena galericulata]|nr:hypothetical protein B0H11DRAFT_2066661 [Mycena galericulata]
MCIQSPRRTTTPPPLIHALASDETGSAHAQGTLMLRSLLSSYLPAPSLPYLPRAAPSSRLRVSTWSPPALPTPLVPSSCALPLAVPPPPIPACPSSHRLSSALPSYHQSTPPSLSSLAPLLPLFPPRSRPLLPDRTSLSLSPPSSSRPPQLRPLICRASRPPPIPAVSTPRSPIVLVIPSPVLYSRRPTGIFSSSPFPTLPSVSARSFYFSSSS